MHFLHIRKTGGTAVKHALSGTDIPFDLVLHPHETRLKDIPVGERVFFFLRDPVSRFVSGFNSRLREGRPRYHYPWSPAEREVFMRFPTPDSLALALADPNPADQAHAASAMRAIRHVSSSYRDQLGNETYLRSRSSDLLFVGRQESLHRDFNTLKELLGLPHQLQLPVDEVAAHQTPAGFSTTLSAASLNVLRAWYRADQILLDACADLMGDGRINAERDPKSVRP